MPTNIATLGRERTIATLARRLYKIEGRGSAELQRRAEAALLAANPRLSSAEGFRAGSHVVVPTVSGLKYTAEVSGPRADGKSPTQEINLRLQALGSRIEDSLNRASANRRAALARLGDNKFVTEARTALPESEAFLSSAQKRLTQEEKEAEVADKRFQEAVSAALSGLEALDKLAGNSRPR